MNSFLVIYGVPKGGLMRISYFLMMTALTESDSKILIKSVFC